DPLQHYVPNGFSANPANPFDATGSRVGPFFNEFKLERFRDVNGNKFPEYLDPLSGQSAPYVYVSSYNGRGYRAADLKVFNDTTLDLADIYRQKAGASGTPYNAKSFQIISPGYDGKYGVGG